MRGRPEQEGWIPGPLIPSSVGMTQRYRPAPLTHKEGTPHLGSLPHLHHTALCAHGCTHALHVLTLTLAHTHPCLLTLTCSPYGHTFVGTYILCVLTLTWAHTCPPCAQTHVDAHTSEPCRCKKFIAQALPGEGSRNPHESPQQVFPRSLLASGFSVAQLNTAQGTI